MGEEKKEINSSSLLVHFDIRVRLYRIPNTINEEGANLKIKESLTGHSILNDVLKTVRYQNSSRVKDRISLIPQQEKHHANFSH